MHAQVPDIVNRLVEWFWQIRQPTSRPTDGALVQYPFLEPVLWPWLRRKRTGQSIRVQDDELDPDLIMPDRGQIRSVVLGPAEVCRKQKLAQMSRPVSPGLVPPGRGWVVVRATSIG